MSSEGALDPDSELRTALARASDELERGARFKESYEKLLLEARDEDAERLMQLQREARATWLLLLRVRDGFARGATALVVGNALSGTSVPLGCVGWSTTLFDTCAERLRFARLRNRSLTPGDDPRTVLAQRGERLPFDDGAFELVVLESRFEDGGPALEELRRVCRGELVRIADNRFGYKRSSGRRGVFRVPGPLEYLRRVLSAGEEQSLAGYRASSVAPGFAPPRAFALYPDAREFTYVVGLDSRLPRLEVGPKERDNKLKLLGTKLGLFPLLTPSFALFSARDELAASPLRAERLLDVLARRTGEPRGALEHLIATRGNSALLMTRASAWTATTTGPGDWCIHVGLSAAQRRQIWTHARLLDSIAARFPAVPVPQLLFCGELDGLFVTCERRVGGLTAPQHTGDRSVARVMLADAARILAELVVEPAAPMTESDFDALVARRFRLVEHYCAHHETAANLRRMLASARESLLGRSFPRVVYHADLRSKHIQLEASGRIAALLDWGSGEERDLPYFDLLHLIVHERKQADGIDAKRAWALVRERRELRDYERAALEDYARRLGLDDEYCRAIEAFYPVLVAAMAESHWDFSRPQWLRRQFGV